MPEGKEEMDCLLDKALADGVIDERQYNELSSRSAVKAETGENRSIQRALIGTGIAIIVFVVGFFILIAFDDFTYLGRLLILLLLTSTLFSGSVMAYKVGYNRLHFGLLAGASNLFVLCYGYWFYNKPTHVNWYQYEIIDHANRSPWLAVPLLLIPIIILVYQIYRNSRGGSQLTLVSLIFGSFILLIRLGDSMEFENDGVYYYPALIGAGILAFIACVNIMWMLEKWEKAHEFYRKRYRTIDSVMSSGYALGSLYLIMLFGMRYGEEESIASGAIVTLVLAFFVIFYGIMKPKKGLFLTACGIVILCTWIFGLASMGGVAFLIMSVLSGFMLIGIAVLMRSVPGFQKGYEPENRRMTPVNPAPPHGAGAPEPQNPPLEKQPEK